MSNPRDPEGRQNPDEWCQGDILCSRSILHDLHPTWHSVIFFLISFLNLASTRKDGIGIGHRRQGVPSVIICKPGPILSRKDEELADIPHSESHHLDARL